MRARRPYGLFMRALTGQGGDTGPKSPEAKARDNKHTMHTVYMICLLFFQLPKFLFTEGFKPLSARAIVLLRDRHELSLISSHRY